jgi:hypothetical protein
MPQPPAYSPAEVILAGQKLEATAGIVTQSALHASLGGRGMPSTAWRIWSEYAELRGPWKPPAPSADPGDAKLSDKAGRAFADVVARMLAFGELMRDETEATHALRAAQTMRAQDDLLAKSARLAEELEEKVAEIDELQNALEQKRAARNSHAITLPLRGPASTWTPPASPG